RELSARELGLAVGRFHDRLVALADRHLHRAPGAFVVEMLEGGGDLLVRRLLAARAFLRLLPGELYAEDRLRHLVGGVVRLALVLPDEAAVEPLVVLVARRIRAEGAARAEHGAVRNLRPELVHRGLAGSEDRQALLHESARARLQDERLEVAVPETRVDEIGIAG